MESNQIQATIGSCSAHGGREMHLDEFARVYGFRCEGSLHSMLSEVLNL